MPFTFKSPARLEWKTAKKKHAAVIQQNHIAFDEGLGPMIDKIDTLYELAIKLSQEAEVLHKKVVLLANSAGGILSGYERQIVAYENKIAPLANGDQAAQDAEAELSHAVGEFRIWEEAIAAAMQALADNQPMQKVDLNHPARTGWKAAKNKHAGILKAHKITFDDGLGAMADKMAGMFEQVRKLGEEYGLHLKKMSAAAKTASIAVDGIRSQIQKYEGKIEPLKKLQDKTAWQELSVALNHLRQYEVGLASALLQAGEGKAALKMAV